MFHVRSHTRHRRFSELYVRHGWRALKPGFFFRPLEIARIEAVETGKGAFKELFAQLKKRYPLLPIYVESVLTQQFKNGLLRLGFEKRDLAQNFVYLPKGHPIWTTEEMESITRYPTQSEILSQKP